MSTVHAQIQISAPPETVWDTIMDPNRLGEWVTIHRSVQLRSADPRSEGAKMDQVLHILGVSFKVHWTLEHVTAAREAEWHGKGPALSRAMIRYRLKRSDAGTTFDYFNDFHIPGGVVGNAASRMIVGRLPEHEAQDSLARLKRVIEGD
jgi:carbon monoxide dehydrogenase subunit G